MQHLQTLAAALALLAAASQPAHADWESSLLPESFDMANTLSKAVAMAQHKQKSVIVYYTRTNCLPCSHLQARLRKDEVAAPFRAGYVFTAAWGSSMDRTERETYRAKFGVQGAPTWLVFDSGGNYVCTSPGGFASDDDAAPLHDAIQARLRGRDAAAAAAQAPGPVPCRV